ncbi:RagB/SusD family nutrient uptake outer membrane protein [Salisaeta longa]|uniref:RagB/SusD family nutrient uptake outer membrane protein n=1 Tax=Salisaeta longa TaxID=503170 RepID=UPI00146F87CC|nr:RagB/SusD family nutrient uptake outer membrane protein [Salisaeta longa]
MFLDHCSYRCRLGVLFIALVALTGCDAFEIKNRPDPNGPSLQDIVENPTRGKIANVAVGMEAGMRTDMNLYLTDVSAIGREVFRFSSSDPRYTSELLGEGSAVLNNNTFYITRPWAERYRVVRNGNIILDALGNAPQSLFTDAEEASIRGFVGTIAAHQLLLNLNLTYQNGIRVEVRALDENELGTVVGYDQALQAIADRLDAAYQDLQAGSGLPFPLSEGFSSVDFPAFNRALKARVAIYQQDPAAALDALQNSFIGTRATPLVPFPNPGGDARQVGAYHVFSTSAGDLTNPWYIPPQATGDLIAAHPSYITDIARDSNGNIIDQRASKVVNRDETFARAGLSSDWGFFVYKTNVSPIPIIRRAELFLIRAEAHILQGGAGNLNDAVDDLNFIRNSAGLPDYSGPVTQDALTDELLRQRRYELYGEGHRWIDMRRYDRLDQLPIDRPNDDVWQQFPIPASENVNSPG